MAEWGVFNNLGLCLCESETEQSPRKMPFQPNFIIQK